MSTRRPLIAGNWKMNTSLAEARDLASSLLSTLDTTAEVIVCPPFPWLQPVKEILAGSTIAIGAQDCWPKPNGAWTGGVSTAMLAELVSHVIVGHSERRQFFGDTDELVRDKITAVLAAGLTPIVCVGESLETRELGDAVDFVGAQLSASLGNRPEAEVAACVIAYEPIWAIGTGIAASTADAQQMTAAIRRSVDGMHPGLGATIRVLYGGSVTPANAAELITQPDVDGALVGGASLKPDLFGAIVQAATA